MALYNSPKAQDFATGATQDVNLARSNVKGPNGSVTWMPPTTPGGQWTQTTTLNPNEQATLTGTQGSNAGMAGGAAKMTPWAVGLEGGPMDYSKFMAGGSRVNGGQYYDKAAGDAVYKQFSDRMEPQFKQQTSAMDVQLRNQGLKPGDEAYDTQMKQVAQEQGDQRERASQDAVQMAGQEGSRMQGMDVSAGNYNTDQRNAQITQELQRRGYGVDEIKKMLAGTDVAAPTGQNGPIGNTYSDAMARTYGEDANASKDANASTGSWLNLAGKVAEPLLNKAGGYIAGKVGSWLGFNPAGGGAADGVTGTAGGVVSDLAQGKDLGTTAKDAAVNYGENAAKGYVKNAITNYGANAATAAAADAAGTAGLTDLGASAAANVAALPSMGAMGITDASLTPAATAAANSAAASSGAAAGAGTAAASVAGAAFAAWVGYNIYKGWTTSHGTSWGGPQGALPPGATSVKMFNGKGQAGVQVGNMQAGYGSNKNEGSGRIFLTNGKELDSTAITNNFARSQQQNWTMPERHPHEGGAGNAMDRVSPQQALTNLKNLYTSSGGQKSLGTDFNTWYKQLGTLAGAWGSHSY